MAMGAKLARLVYRMLSHGMKFIDRGADFYEAQHRHRQINALKWKAQFPILCESGSRIRLGKLRP
jgi:hypothetical protein